MSANVLKMSVFQMRAVRFYHIVYVKVNKCFVYFKNKTNNIEVIDMDQLNKITEFVIPGRLGSMNEYINKCRTNHYMANNYKHNQQSIVAIASIGIEPIPDVYYPLILKYKFYEGNRKRDLDNVESWAKKCIQDALTNTGKIKNDGWNEIAGSESLFYIDRDNPRIEVSIYSANQKNNKK